ncbi:replicase [Tomato necrotic streak virus]|uniref:RNA-directed RNA polymerase 2a n=1 Tax=Tomato necrotic streak virus TaxID=1637492 RepID=A0A140GPI6_9BROM|nr:replicase [Tomato necrotic streak virus]AMN16529.1 replicase [Tomato necrotic streak virus]
MEIITNVLDLVSTVSLRTSLQVHASFDLPLSIEQSFMIRLWLVRDVVIPTMKVYWDADALLGRLETVFSTDPEPVVMRNSTFHDIVPEYVDEFGEVPEEAYLSPEEREEIHKATFLKHEHWGSESSGSSFLDEIECLYDETVKDDVMQDVCTDMPKDYEIMWNDGAVDAVWSSRFEVEEPPKPKFRPQMTDKVCDPVIIQDAINDIFPFHQDMDDTYFQTWVETQDISLEVSKCWLDASNFKDFTKGQQTYAVPTYQSGATSKRVNTQRETLLAVKKRNMNIPELQATFDLDAEVATCFKRFCTHVVDIPRLKRLPPMMGTETEFFHRLFGWYNPPLSEYRGPLTLQSLDKYMHMVKTIVKPVEDNSLKYERPLCATITLSKKGIVMQSSPLFLSAMSRLFYVLKSKIHIPSGKWHQLFTLDATAFDAAQWFKEVDFSKFDKSQGELHHKVQKLIFDLLKLPPEFVEMWFTSHERSHITDRDTGVGFSVDYQRRTGDANTYLGNTLVTLICLARVYDLCDPKITFIIASGDDSLIGSVEELPRAPEHLFTSLFNFEAKFPHNQPFICSKFLVSVDLADGGREVIAVPNPAKLLIRMGRRDCQFQSLDDLYISWLDVIYYFRDSRVCEKVAELCAYRQTRRSSMYLLSALLSLPSCFANLKKFKLLCYNLTEEECLKKTKLTRDTHGHVEKEQRVNGCRNKGIVQEGTAIPAKNGRRVQETSTRPNSGFRAYPQRKSRGCWIPHISKVFQAPDQMGGCSCAVTRKSFSSIRSAVDVSGFPPAGPPSRYAESGEFGDGTRTGSSYAYKNSRPRNRLRAQGVHQSRCSNTEYIPSNNRRST